MHDEVRLSEQRCEVLGIAERGANSAASERLGGTDHAIDRIRVVHRYVRTCCGGECSSRLTGAAATEDENVTPTQTPCRNGWRL
jgi:hypothetical protein